ncbi:type V CRISPR-associated protein Cas12k [Leptolyngbya ohadii]|uniref:type V CRISPR-associated protein Cas12k n=1 Tax=Leptolyngbya ohadii TaxID=1962290 RepID=UPI000B59F0E3|nr:type V CRISPR-associated protein Cas12k [Leptolyngbya ohadii]
MSIITIHCRLTAPESVRRHLWLLMSGRNTPLINDLLKRVSQHPDFETWQYWGTVPKVAIKELCEPLKELYPGQPARFYASAILMVTYIYESWLSLQQTRRHRLNGKQRWLEVVKSDAELLEMSSSTLETIRHRAQEILSRCNVESTPQSESSTKKRSKQQGQSSASSSKSLMTRLFETYNSADDILSRCAIAHLMKNDCKVSATEEDPKEFAHRILRKQKDIEQLEAQLQARLPKGRDLTGEEFLKTLTIATQQISASVAEARDWQGKLLTRPKSLPYPIIYGSSTDVRWGKTAKGRITVSFNGIDKYLKEADSEIQEWFKTQKEYPFRLYCDQRQLPFFQRFLEDWQAYQANKDTYPAGLLTLSSATLGWREGEGKGEPWQVNHLVLYCSFDTRLMTAEGTLAVQQEKASKALKNLARENSDPRNLSTLNRLQNLPERPSRKPYQGNPEILVGLSVGLTHPVTVAVVNGRTGDALTYRTPRTLLGDRYPLLNRQRQRQKQNALQRHKNQKRGVAYQPSESELGQYVDRLLAKSIIQLAQQYQAGSIVIPNLKHLRELLSSEITAKAEQKCSGSVEAQDKYAKEFRQRIHRWSYNRLLEAICSKANQVGITIETGFQPSKGTFQEQAKDLAIATYHSRAINKK